MLLYKKLRLNKFKAFLVALVVSAIAIYNYLQIDNVEVFIETNSEKEELFIIYTSIRNYGFESHYTTGGTTRLVKSGSPQTLSIQLGNLLLFDYFQAWIYHPDYIPQIRNKLNRTILRTAKFPRLTPVSWANVISNKVKISISEPNVMDVGAYLKAVESGKIIRIVDVMGQLRVFKDDYIPLFLTQGSKEQLREYLPGLKELVSYAKANIDVDYEQLEEHDREYLRLIDQQLTDIEEMLK